MIDIGSARGAWRGVELASLGQLYDYIKSHLDGASAKVAEKNVVPVNPATVRGVDDK
jgi:hypothetical protein